MFGGEYEADAMTLSEARRSGRAPATRHQRPELPEINGTDFLVE